MPPLSVKEAVEFAHWVLHREFDVPRDTVFPIVSRIYETDENEWKWGTHSLQFTLRRTKTEMTITLTQTSLDEPSLSQIVSIMRTLLASRYKIRIKVVSDMVQNGLLKSCNNNTCAEEFVLRYTSSLSQFFKEKRKTKKDNAKPDGEDEEDEEFHDAKEEFSEVEEEEKEEKRGGDPSELERECRLLHATPEEVARCVKRMHLLHRSKGKVKSALKSKLGKDATHAQVAAAAAKDEGVNQLLKQRKRLIEQAKKLKEQSYNSMTVVDEVVERDSDGVVIDVDLDELFPNATMKLRKVATKMHEF